MTTNLKKIAAYFGCTIEDDETNATIYIHAPPGRGWDGGTLTALVHHYGSRGSTKRKWKLDAITDAEERLTEIGAPEDDAVAAATTA